MFIIKKILPLLVILTFVLAACSGSKEQTMEVPEASNFKSIEIQKIVNNKEVKKETVVIKDEAKIEAFLDSVNGIKTKEQNITDTEKEMKDIDSYFVYFELKDADKAETAVPYSIFTTVDGTVFFTHKDIDKLDLPQKSVEKHMEVVDLIKEIANY